MLVDLNIYGKRVLVFGGGREATRKVEALLTQDCEIIVVAERVSDSIQRWSEADKLKCVLRRVEDGGFLNEYEPLHLVMAASDDKSLNRRIAEIARKQDCFAYCVDDPEASDFSHPAVMSFSDTVQVAVSTGGRSPLMAGKLKRKIQPVLQELISAEDILWIRLQEFLRTRVADVLSQPDQRKRFLESVFEDETVRLSISEGDLESARTAALKLLDDSDQD